MSIKIPHNPPRGLMAFKGKIDFRKQYRGYVFYGGIFLTLAIMVGTSFFFPPLETDLIIFKSVMVILGLIIGINIFLHVTKKHKERIQAFTHGTLVHGTVIAHGRKFVPWKSARDYTITIQVPHEKDREARKSDSSFHSEYPMQSHITLLFDHKTKSAFIPAEVDVEIE